MASSGSLISGTRFMLVVTTLFCVVKCVYCSEFEVGERSGWVVPRANDTEMYNQWASRKRFKVGDTIRFKYKKDSVMEVEKQDYSKCDSTHPNFFSNTGNTVFALDRSGFFYFISGAAGHCSKGQKMIVWVMAQDGPDERETSQASNNAMIFSYGLLAILIYTCFSFL